MKTERMQDEELKARTILWTQLSKLIEYWEPRIIAAAGSANNAKGVEKR